jgi:hypothetical protein
MHLLVTRTTTAKKQNVDWPCKAQYKNTVKTCNFVSLSNYSAILLLCEII